MTTNRTPIGILEGSSHEGLSVQRGTRGAAERIYQAWRDTDEPWGGCDQRENVERVIDRVLWPLLAEAWEEGRTKGAEFWGKFSPNPYLPGSA